MVMSKLLSSSNLHIGLIEEVDIFKVKESDKVIRDSNIPSVELIKSISQNGLLQPIIVRLKGDLFEIVAGHRRFNACRNLGWRKIICHIVELDDKEAFELFLVENIHRRNLDPLEEAKAFRIYVDEFGWGGVSDLSQKIDKSYSYISKRLALLELPADVLENVSNSLMNVSMAEELISIKDSERQNLLSKMIVDNKLSFRQTRSLVSIYKDARSNKLAESSDDPDLIVEDMLLNKNNSHAQTKLMNQQLFNKSITALKIAANKLGSIIDGIDDDWILIETLMYHKKMIDSHIDILIKEKKKSTRLRR